MNLKNTLLNLSIVLPCYNPKPDWHLQVAQQYKRIKNFLKPGTEIEIIVVNDGSSIPINASAKKFLAKRCPYFQFISYVGNMGKGYAVRKGVEAARSPYIIYTDIDFPYTTEDICEVYDVLQKGVAELVMGTREAAYNKKLSLIRKLASSSCNYLTKKMLNLPYKDTQSGLKGINTLAKELLLKTTINRFLFDTEFIWMASLYSNIRIKALPVSLRQGVSFTSMGASVYVNEAGNFCRLLLKDKLLLLKRFDEEFRTTI